MNAAFGALEVTRPNRLLDSGRKRRPRRVRERPVAAVVSRLGSRPGVCLLPYIHAGNGLNHTRSPSAPRANFVNYLRP
jgi:hypothetical protein